MSEGTEYAVHGVGPNSGTVRIDLPHPVNVLVGENGAGKSLALQAIFRTAGDRSSEVVKNRDSDAAWVQGPGVVMKTSGSRVTVRGASDSLADYGQIHELLDPVGKTPQTRDKNRARALMGFYAKPVDQEMITALCGGDETIAGGVIGEVERLGLKAKAGLATVAQKAKGFIDLLARNRESEALEHKGAADAAKRRAKEIRGDLAGYDRPGGDAETLSEEVAERAIELGGLDQARQVRVAREEERERAKGLEVDPPEPRMLAVEVAEFERIVRYLVNRRKGHRPPGSSSEDIELRTRESLGLGALQGRQHAWDERQRILAEPIEGPTAEEIEAAEVELAQYVEDLEALKAYEEMDRQTLEKEDAQAKQDIEAEKALELRQLAKGVMLEVNKILSRENFGGLMLDEDMGLCFAGPETEGEVVPFEELSEGQRAQAVLLGVGVSRYPDKMIPVSRQWWWSLQPERMRGLVKLVGVGGIRIVTELPTDQPGITVIGLGQDWIDSGLRAETYIERIVESRRGRQISPELQAIIKTGKRFGVA